MRALSPQQKRALRDLYEASETPMVKLDPDVGGHSPHTLVSLQRRRLAKPVEAGLWRITLGGLLHVRYPPKRGRPPNKMRR